MGLSINRSSSARSNENEAITGKIKQCWLESGAIYGYRKIHDDLRHLGIACGQQRVRRLMKAQGLRSQTGYRRRPNSKPGEAAAAAPNVLDRKLEVATPNDSWVVDITYIKTHEGWLTLYEARFVRIPSRPKPHLFFGAHRKAGYIDAKRLAKSTDRLAENESDWLILRLCQTVS